MNVLKIRKVCRIVRVVLGLGLIATGVITGNYWFFLGTILLVAAFFNICPLCKITGQCDMIPKKDS